jgi:nucleotide-binding universal stress UspA family protein
MKKIILVPTDFTKVSETALGHSLVMAKNLNADIALIHIVENQLEVKPAKEKLVPIAEKAALLSNIKIHPIVRIGDIFDSIGDVAVEIDASLIIMGTHGVRGFQYFTGSNALKIISNSPVPFIVVQEKEIKSGYDEIVLPLDFRKESKQKLKMSVELAKSFNSKIFIITPREDDEFLLNSIKRNVAFAKGYMEENQVPYEIKVADKKGDFVKQVINYAVDVEADLIAIVNSNELSIVPEFIKSPDEQTLITNPPHIPVLVMNPAPVTLSAGVLGS